MKKALYAGGLVGLAVLIVLLVRTQWDLVLRALESSGAHLLWLIPYRGAYFLLYAVGWWYLLRPADGGQRPGLGYLWWATTVREAVDRLLPVASVGGAVVGVRLLGWRAVAAAPAAASIIVEIVLTIIALYLFSALGLLLLMQAQVGGQVSERLLLALLLALPVPAVLVLILRYGSVFARLQRWFGPLLGLGAASDAAASLDHELRATMRRGWTLCGVGGLQCVAMISASFEIWFALRLFGQPVGIGTAIILESLIQALRHLAFIVPAGLGVQEAGFVLFGHALGVGSEMALAVSMAKRMREVLCGVPPLLSWQWLEARRLRRMLRE